MTKIEENISGYTRRIWEIGLVVEVGGKLKKKPGKIPAHAVKKRVRGDVFSK